jgi:hypothetical protein
MQWWKQRNSTCTVHATHAKVDKDRDIELVIGGHQRYFALACGSGLSCACSCVLQILYTAVEKKIFYLHAAVDTKVFYLHAVVDTKVFYIYLHPVVKQFIHTCP